MPAGCDLICNNDKCDHYKEKIVITGPWPMGDIDLVINAINVKKNENFRNKLIELKESGRKYACITYPNLSDIPIVGYRVQKWCNNCSQIWMYDVILNNETFEEALNKSNIPVNCPKCNGNIEDFESTIFVGVNCPYCKEEMQQERWFAKEWNSEEKRST